MGNDKKLSADKAYTEALATIVKTIEQSQVKMVMAANTQMLWAYWNIGNELSARTKANAWGAKVIDNLSNDLRKNFPAIKGFSARNLLYMRQFAEAYPPALIGYLNKLWQQVNTNTQQLVALLKNNKSFEIAITQPAVAQFTETDFMNSLIGKISWSHHLVLIDKGKNEIIAEYALKGYNQPIGVADYVLSKAVPENLQSTLPQIEELEQELKELGHEN